MSQPVVWTLAPRIEIRNLLKRLGELKKTVIVSSHILPELADVCTRVGMIEKGNLIVDGQVGEVMKKARQRIVLQIQVKGDTAETEPRCSTAGTARPCRQCFRFRKHCHRRHPASGNRRLQRTAVRAARRKVQTEIVPRRRSEPRDRLHGINQGPGSIELCIQENIADEK